MLFTSVKLHKQMSLSNRGTTTNPTTPSQIGSVVSNIPLHQLPQTPPTFSPRSTLCYFPAGQTKPNQTKPKQHSGYSGQYRPPADPAPPTTLHFLFFYLSKITILPSVKFLFLQVSFFFRNILII